MTTLVPTGIRADKTARTVQITWSDEHISVYNFDGLRLACPCVECKGGHANMGIPTSKSAVKNAPATDLQLLGIEAVGTYAIQPNWSDGHNTGFYSWELLREICPCDQCLPT